MVGSIPLGVRNDEASFGYNAYSILETGKDEHGEKYPLIFKAFGDQKLPAYMYSIVPAIKIFGLNNFAVRLPSVLAGTLSALIFYFIALRFDYIRKYAFIASLIFAASPWSIILSRSAYESNLGLMFFLGGLYFLIKNIQEKKRSDALLSGILFGLSWYSYIAYRLISALLILWSFLYTSVKTRKLQLIHLCIALLITILPLLPSLFTHQGMARFEHVGLFADDGPVMEIVEARTFCTQHFPRILCYADSNKILVYGRNMLNSFVQTISPDYLFINGDNNTVYLDAEHFGNLHYYLLPFYLLGLVYLISTLYSSKKKTFELLILVGFLISTIPAVLTHGPQLVRTSSLLPFLILITTFGIAYGEEFITKSSLKKLYQPLHTITAISFGYIFLFNYIGISIPKNDVQFYSHIPPLMKYLHTIDSKTPIHINKLPEAVMFYAYVNKVSPTDYQKNARYPEVDARGFSHAHSLNNIHYTPLDYQHIVCEKPGEEGIYVATESLSESINPKKMIYSANKVHTLFYVYDILSLPKPDCSEITQIKLKY